MTKRTKICPLLSVGRAGDPAPCLGDRCGWWRTYHNRFTNETCGECVLLTAADALDNIDSNGINVNT